MCAHCVMAGIWPCFLDVSSPSLNGTAPFTPMCNLENMLHARAQVTIGLCASPARGLREHDSYSRPTASYGQPKQKQQQQWSMGPKSSASKLSQILVPSPLWKLPSPKEQIHKYKQVTIRAHHGHNTKHVL